MAIIPATRTDPQRDGENLRAGYPGSAADPKRQGWSHRQILVDKGLVNDDDIRLAIARQSGMEPVDLGEVVMTADLLDMVPAHVAETYQVIPVDFDGSVLTLALADPQNVSALDDMKFMLNVDVKGALSDPAAVEAAPGEVLL